MEKNADVFLPNEESPALTDVHSFFDYRKWSHHFQEMQNEIRSELKDGTLGDNISIQGNYSIMEKPGEWSDEPFDQLHNPYIDTNSSHFISFVPYVTYDRDTDEIYVVFDIPDHEVDDEDAYYPLEYLNSKLGEPEFQFYIENEHRLAIPAKKFVSMTLDEFQKTFENGAMNLFEECLENYDV